ncbi:toxin-antitoxin system HicB family antitoxin [Pseudomonas sp. GWSMS-1]|uniref:toxin-antitoxin system HicB family antitoxin n=1 Tax=Pseudomonas sp. GWSMS-1 TaxID=3308997 RepID=UPI003CFB8BA6
MIVIGASLKALHAATAAVLYPSQACVNDCLADCAERGVSPQKSASGKIMLRIRPAVHAAATQPNQQRRQVAQTPSTR